MNEVIGGKGPKRSEGYTLLLTNTPKQVDRKFIFYVCIKNLRKQQTTRRNQFTLAIQDGLRLHPLPRACPLSRASQADFLAGILPPP